MITQEYETNAEREYVIIGNTALMKCEIPSFVADFVSVESWKDNKNNEGTQKLRKQKSSHSKDEDVSSLKRGSKADSDELMVFYPLHGKPFLSLTKCLVSH